MERKKRKDEGIGIAGREGHEERKKEGVKKERRKEEVRREEK